MSQSDLETALWQAWQKVWPRLQSHPDELNARLARRRSKMYLRPLRATCLAVRASDRRINSWDAITVPDDAADPRRPDRYRQHIVQVDKPLLLRICAPVTLNRFWGEDAKSIAKLLGCTTSVVQALKRTGFKSGRWRVRYHLNSNFTRPEPAAGSRRNPAIYHTTDILDPNAYAKRRPDPIFGPLFAWYAKCLPDDFSHDLTRVPHYGPARRLHQFLGWRWICPDCKKHVRFIYLPQGAPDWGRYVNLQIPNDADDLPEPLPCFACANCHGLIGFSRAVLSTSWNNLILHLSGGLLYGREVRRPAWLTKDRQKKFTPRPRPRPRQDKLQHLLLTTSLPLTQIAITMGNAHSTIKKHASNIYRRHHVHSREQLRDKILLQQARKAVVKRTFTPASPVAPEP